MDKRDFFAHWEAADRITRKILEAFPPEALSREIIPGVMPPGRLFCHIFAHANAVFNACITRQMMDPEPGRLPDHVDTTQHKSLLRYAQDTMNQLLAHASVGDDFWRLQIETPKGVVPMDSLCLESFAHEIHHRGQLVAMLRALGKDPPAVCRHSACPGT